MGGFDNAAAVFFMTLVDAAGRSLILALLAGAGIAVCRVRWGATRLAVWRWVLCAALVMPALPVLVPSIAIPVPAWNWGSTVSSAGAVSVAAVQIDDLAAIAAGVADAERVPWVRVASLLYLAGLALFAAGAARGWTAARRVTRGAITIDDAGLRSRVATHASTLAMTSTPRLAVSSRITVPVTAGVRDPVILLPPSWRSWDADALDAVLLHELSHIARGDALTQRLALVYRIVCWPNPLAWWLGRHLAALAETASDEAVLASRVAAIRYAEVLLGFLSVASRSSGTRHWHVAMARVSGAERRIHRVLTWKERRPMSNSIARSLATAAAVAVLAGTVSAARLEPLAAPVPVAVPPPVVFDAAPGPFLSPVPAPVPAPATPEAQKPAPTRPQSQPSSPDDDFAKGAYAQDTPGLIHPVVTQSGQPRYTAEAMRAKLQGDIRLEIVVSHEGYVTRARVAGVSGNLEFLGVDTQVEPSRRNLGLDEQALAAIRQWRFVPGTLNGVPVPVLTSVHLSFRLF